MNGSSPLARGALQVAAGSLLNERLIPAGAGSTRQTVWSSPRRTAHPRWRGEHNGLVQVSELLSGSSPLARGAPVRSLRHPEGNRLIPAGAGSTGAVAQGVQVSAAHPRWRGEHCLRASAWVRRIGSSPLARGAHSCSHGLQRGLRLIPAGAGSTRSSSRSGNIAEAHPRWRGEHCVVH